MDSWGIIAVIALISLTIPIVGIAAAYFLGPRRPGPIKLSIYECGLESEGDIWVQFKVQYYLYALIFVLFDVETVFLYPWAVAYNKLGIFALVEMFIFLFILGIGLVYAWRKGALEWV